MSKFEVKVVRVDEVLDHPDADRLSLNRIGGYIAVSNKTDEGEHRYRADQLVVYVPEGAVVPLEILEQFGYTHEGKGILAGSKGNRVKAIKLRGVVSQGLIFPIKDANGDMPMVTRGEADYMTVNEGDDVAEFFDIVKYEPVIPASMSGDVVHYPELTINFDLENVQKYPDLFADNELVYVTEKLHGTFCGYVFVSAYYCTSNGIDVNNLIPFANSMYATAFSKGLGAKGLVFKATPENEARNLYLRALRTLIDDPAIAGFLRMNTEFVGGKSFILGEIYGKGVQDLDYSLTKPQFAMFNIVTGGGEYMSAKGMFDLIKDVEAAAMEDWKVPDTAPLLAIALPFKQVVDNIADFRDGVSAVDSKTLREGCVIVPAFEGRDDRIGRRALKCVSPAYLTRKGGTEYN